MNFMKSRLSKLNTAVALGSTLLLLLPLLVLTFHLSWPGVWQVWRAQGGAALWVSVQTTLMAMAFILVFGTPLGWLLSRGQARTWRWLEFFLLIPLLMPPLVIGLLLIYLYGPYGVAGRLLALGHLSATNTLLAVVVAQVYEAMPYYVFVAQEAFNQVDQGFERASLSLGVAPVKTFLRVTLPLSLPGLTVGFTMAFARAIGAFGAVIVVAYYPHTLPVSVWIALQEQGLSVALPLAALLLVISLPLPLAAVLWRRLHHVTGTS
ncbi:ABC transporter permease subunit [Alicyclobacillaceae bacterium I2511]|nr:ABC transporter permease subunit [Alicyclobacillaceae bacterium I2511]